MSKVVRRRRLRVVDSGGASAVAPVRPNATDLARKEVIKRFRAKGTPYLGKLIKQSPAIARQFIPSSEELEPHGIEDWFVEGKDNRGLYGIERVYRDRAVITPYFECAAYCRFCFKKTRTLAGDAKRMTDEEIARAIAYVRSDPRLNTILITGGDPFIDPALLEQVVAQVASIPHVSKIRIGTRNILFEPQKVTEELVDSIARHRRLDFADLSSSLNISIGFTLNHPDELTREVLEAADRFIRRGIAVRAQTVLLKGVNDDAATMARLLDGFLTAGLIPYYLYHCSPVVGTKHFRTSVQRGIDILAELHALSGALDFQNYVYVTQVGKHRVGPGQRLDTALQGGLRYIRARSPYRYEDFLEFTGKSELPPMHSVDDSGFILSHYLDGSDD